MGISEACIRRPVMTTLITASLIVFGAFAYRLLSVSALPAVDFPTISITATLPGASPETMAASVASPIERQLSTIAGISALTSTSALGTTTITVQFDLNRNIDGAALDVQTALTVAARRLPVEMTTPPFFRKVNPGDFPVLFVSLNSPTLPMSTVDEYGQTVLAQQISQLPGVAQVLVYGGQKFAVRVQADPVAAAARNISLEDIRTALTKANSNTPVGTIAGERQNITLSASAAISKAADYRNVIVAYRNGAPVKLEEIANVIDGVENTRIASFFNGNRSVVLAIQRQPDANTVAVVDSVKSRIPAYRSQIPAVHQHASADGSLDLDPRVGARRAGDPADRDRAGHPGDLPVPAHGFCHDHSGTRGADFADRDLRGDVRAQFLDQQHDAARAHAVGRIRRRRCDRDAGKHRAPHRGRDAAVRGRAQGRARNRLHHHLDHRLADRGVHPGAADGRHGGARVPRVCRHHRGRDHRVGLRLADADADALRARAAHAS